MGNDSMRFGETLQDFRKRIMQGPAEGGATSQSDPLRSQAPVAGVFDPLRMPAGEMTTDQLVTAVVELQTRLLESERQREDAVSFLNFDRRCSRARICELVLAVAQYRAAAHRAAS